MDSDQIRTAYKNGVPVEDTETGIVGVIITVRSEPGTGKVSSLVVMGTISDPDLPLDPEQPTQADRKYATIWHHQFERLKVVRPPIGANPLT